MRRVWVWGGFLAVALAALALVVLGIQHSAASPLDAPSERSKKVDIDETQYIWELVSNVDGSIICQVVVDHPTRPSYEETIQICGSQIFPPEPTRTPLAPTATPNTAQTATATQSATRAPTATPEPFDLATYFNHVTWRFASSRVFKRTVYVPVPEIIVNLSVSPNVTGVHIATIAAYEPVYGQRITGMVGTLNGAAFTCSAPRCELPILGDASLEFWATSSFGDESRHAQADLRLEASAEGSTLKVVSITPRYLFQDACAQIWGKPAYDLPAWAALPATPEDLHTQKPYQFLAGKLLAAGYVTSAADCPGGGLMSNGAPNTCGLEKSINDVVGWQNQFDVAIWSAGRDMGIPPRILKTLVEQESQFWPGNGQRGAFEYGLGQLNPNGADVALRWDNNLFSTTCNGLMYDCSRFYGKLPGWAQATLRGGLMRSIDAECPTCPHGLDMEKAFNSLTVVAQTLRSNCRQVKFMTDTMGVRNAFGYEDLWRFTLVSYHSGYQCLRDAFNYASYNEQVNSWDQVVGYLSCQGSQYYANTTWKSLQEFDVYRLPAAAGETVQVKAAFVPTATPLPSPTPVLALSHLRVEVYMDGNANQYPDPGEGVDGMLVTATFADGRSMQARTQKGVAIIDFSGLPVADQDVSVSLPTLYRIQKVRVTRDGEVPVVFRLEQPVVPPALP